MDKNDTETAIIAVPFDAVDELESEGLASAWPVFRGAALEAAVTVGVDSAALVTLMQAPDAIRALASWIRRRCRATENVIDISARHGGRRVHLTVDGDLDVAVIAGFLVAALADEPPHSQAESGADSGDGAA
jgi:hypothetical protein